VRGVKNLLDRVSRQSHARAQANARAAATALSRARVEREEVELFLATHTPRRRVSRTA
jgi:hypothetical protein